MSEYTSKNLFRYHWFICIYLDMNEHTYAQIRNGQYKIQWPALDKDFK